MTNSQAFELHSERYGNFIEEHQHIAANLDIRILRNENISSADDTILTAFHLINLLGLFLNGGLALYHEQFGIDRRTAYELRRVSMSDLANDVERFLADGDLTHLETSVDIGFKVLTTKIIDLLEAVPRAE